MKYAAKKLAELALAMLALSVIIFALSRLAPGDPLRAYYGDGLERMSTEQKARAEEKLGLNEPLPVQYIKWAGGAIHGDFGISYKYKRPVTEVISGVWMNTLLLGGVSFILIFLGAFILGGFCAMRAGSRTDRMICRIGVVTSSVPEFFLAILLLLFLAVKLPLFPTGGAYDIGASGSLLSRLYHAVLPIATMVIAHLWYYSFMARNLLTDEAGKDYVLLCKAKGLSRKAVMRKHMMRNIMPQMITVMATALPHILAGTYIVEMIYSYPGIGKLAFESAKYLDYNMLMVTTLITGAIVIVFGMISEIAAARLDPRMRREKAPGTGCRGTVTDEDAAPSFRSGRTSAADLPGAVGHMVRNHPDDEPDARTELKSGQKPGTYRGPRPDTGNGNETGSLPERSAPPEGQGSQDPGTYRGPRPDTVTGNGGGI